MLLPLHRSKRFLNEVPALVDRHCDENPLTGACGQIQNRRGGEPLAGTIPLPGDQALLKRRGVASTRRRGSRLGLHACQAAEFVEQQHALRAGGGQKGGVVRIGVAEQFGVDRWLGGIERDIQLVANRVADGLRVADHLREFPHEHAVWMAAGEVANPRVVVHPHREGETGIEREHPVPTSIQRIDYIPRRTKHEEITGIRHELGPEVQKEHRARILPAPGLQQAPFGLHEFDCLCTKSV